VSIAAPFDEILTSRLRIRRLRPGDAPAIFAYRNDPAVARFQSWQPLSEEELRGFIARLDADDPGRPDSAFQFAVARRADDALLGDLYLGRLASDPRQAELGYTLAQQHQGHGYASEAVGALLGYAFEQLGLHRVMALVDCANERSVALLERVGMRREGHFLQHYLHRGEYRDEYQYALLASEWAAGGGAR
jgi:RimJ/RimL family protein N-acetyltransferase